jgi:hypothetical protein
MREFNIITSRLLHMLQSSSFLYVRRGMDINIGYNNALEWYSGRGGRRISVRSISPPVGVEPDSACPDGT